MPLIAIIGLIVLGILLVFVELLIVPGVTIVGVLGVLLMGLGIYFTFNIYGDDIGFITLGGVIVTSAVLTYIGFRSGSWKKLALKDTVEGRVNVISEDDAKVGDTGKTLSDLRPIGKALINGKKVDVHAQSGFIEKDNEIEIALIETNNIFVKIKS